MLLLVISSSQHHQLRELHPRPLPRLIRPPRLPLPPLVSPRYRLLDAPWQLSYVMARRPLTMMRQKKRNGAEPAASRHHPHRPDF